LHFAGKLKPWLIQFNSETKVASVSSEYAHAQDLIQLWWNIFCENVIQSLSTEMVSAIYTMDNAHFGNFQRYLVPPNDLMSSLVFERQTEANPLIFTV